VQATATQNIFDQLFSNITSGQWPTGSMIPSERTLIGEYGVSRIAVREAISMLRGIGVLDVSHGRRTIVKKIDADAISQLFPLMIAGGGQQTFNQIFEVRIAIESHAAYLAASRCTNDDANELKRLAKRFREQIAAKNADSTKTDLQFHMTIARVSQNPLFSSLLEALFGFIAYAQVESCKNDPQRSKRAATAHDNIAEAIAERDGRRAMVEMESHLRYSATRKLEKPTK
jgi:GntR family transcriptional regulator, transcriptional repressor for pyruvate dehydrogenase complex